MRQLATAALTLTLMTGMSAVALAADAGTVPAQPTTTTPATPAATPAATSAAAPAVSKPAMHRTAMVHRYHQNATGDRDTKALNLLEANGYAQIVQFRPDGKNFDATVTQGGKDVQVSVDPDNGQIQHHA